MANDCFPLHPYENSLKYLNFRNAAERERRTEVGKKYAESWESLDPAIISSNPSSNERFRDHAKTAQERQFAVSRGAVPFRILKD